MGKLRWMRQPGGIRMKQEETNVAILREAYAAWHESKGGASIWLEILANEVAWGSLADGRPRK